MVQRGSIGLVYQGKVVTFTPVETRKYVYLGGAVIRELDASNNVLKEYVRGLDMGGGIGSIIYQKKSSGYYYYHYNHKGDVVALTDGNGKLAAFYEYDAWGNVMTEAEKSGVDNPYRYSTKEWDEKSRLYYFGFRYYSPEIGRWTQREPLGVLNSLNLYTFVSSSPPNVVDADGLWDSYVHRDLTTGWAIRMGFSKREAQFIGECTDYMDSKRFRWLGISNWAKRKGELWHRPSQARVEFLKQKALETCNCFDIGAYLHALQDYFIHRHYWPRFGHWNESLFPGGDRPDDWFYREHRSDRDETSAASLTALEELHDACCKKGMRVHLKSSYLWKEYKREGGD
jgi:RHS repeat-associated protein